MTVLHTGSTKKFAAGWNAVFGGGKSGKKAPSRCKPDAVKKKPAAAKKRAAKKKRR